MDTLDDKAEEGNEDKPVIQLSAGNPFAQLLQPSFRPSPSESTVLPPGAEGTSNEDRTVSESTDQSGNTVLRYLKTCRDLQPIQKSVVVSLSDDPLQSRQRTHYDPAGYPVAVPIHKLEDLFAWEVGEDDLCVASIKLRASSSLHQSSVLICHDMMGGYLNDRFVQGHANSDDYNFYHWQHISVFIYFSHNFVTIPPPCWTNAAHRHGVLSLGTVITEWHDGARLCSELLASEGNVQLFVTKLIAIAEYYNFDGWLINIENPIHPSQLDNLYMMLGLLTTGLHRALPHSRVIWYDSVITSGQIQYQNKLSELNDPFFNMCDGIFLNYGWTRSCLDDTVARAGDRLADVFVGIDVFGRGCFGGGGYNSNLAAKLITQRNLSTALFAPGWVFECENKDRFFENQDRYWSLLAPYCPTNAVCGLPLVSCFSRGRGNRVFIDGKAVSETSWANLSAQELQPSFHGQYFKNSPSSAIQLYGVSEDLSKAYNNGSSLKVTGSITLQQGVAMTPANIRLFKTDQLSLRDPILVAYTYQADPSLGHMIRLRTNSTPKFILLNPDISCDVKKDETKFELPISQTSPLPSHLAVDSSSHIMMAPLPQEHSHALHTLYTGEEEDEAATSVWSTRYFLVHHPELRTSSIQGISLALFPKEGEHRKANISMNIGELKILDPRTVSHTHTPTVISSINFEDLDCDTSRGNLSLTLVWLSADSPLDPLDHTNIYHTVRVEEAGDTGWECPPTFIGRAYGGQFRVIKLDVPVGVIDEGGKVFVKFILQPVSISRQKSCVQFCPSVTIDFAL